MIFESHDDRFVLLVLEELLKLLHGVTASSLAGSLTPLYNLVDCLLLELNDEFFNLMRLKTLRILMVHY